MILANLTSQAGRGCVSDQPHSLKTNECFNENDVLQIKQLSYQYPIMSFRLGRRPEEKSNLHKLPKCLL